MIYFYPLREGFWVLAAGNLLKPGYMITLCETYNTGLPGLTSVIYYDI
jgi:hypothetical protein